MHHMGNQEKCTQNKRNISRNSDIWKEMMKNFLHTLSLFDILVNEWLYM